MSMIGNFHNVWFDKSFCYTVYGDGTVVGANADHSSYDAVVGCLFSLSKLLVHVWQTRYVNWHTGAYVCQSQNTTITMFWYFKAFFIRLCTHVGDRCYQSSDGQFVPSAVFMQFQSTSIQFYKRSRCKFLAECNFLLPEPKKMERQIRRWMTQITDACEHSNRNQCNPKNQIRKSDDVHLHVCTIRL